MGLVIKKKPIEGSYNNEIINGTFTGSDDNWFEQGSGKVWSYGGGLVTASAVSSPSNPAKSKSQYIPIVAGQTYNYSIDKDVSSFDNATVFYFSLVGDDGASQTIVSSTNTADGLLTLSGTFVALYNFYKVRFNVQINIP